MRVVQLGFGAVGQENIRQILRRGHELAGVVDKSESLSSESLGRISELAGAPTPIVTNDLSECLALVRADVILQATTFDPDDMMSVVRTAAAAACNVISINGIAHIARSLPDLHRSLDEIASRAGIRVLGVGAIPGFFSDFVPLMMTGACADVTAIRVRRCADFSKWGPDVMARYGFGLAPDCFEQGTRTGQISLFKSLWQSAHAIADELGWEIVSTTEAKDPVVSTRERIGEHTVVASGTVGGFSHSIGITADRGRSLELQVTGFIDPAGAGEQPAMTIDISGTPDIHLSLSGGILLSAGALASSSARMVNSMEALAKAAPGLRSTADLELIACRTAR